MEDDLAAFPKDLEPYTITLPIDADIPRKLDQSELPFPDEVILEKARAYTPWVPEAIEAKISKVGVPRQKKLWLMLLGELEFISHFTIVWRTYLVSWLKDQ